MSIWFKLQRLHLQYSNYGKNRDINVIYRITCHSHSIITGVNKTEPLKDLFHFALNDAYFVLPSFIFTVRLIHCTLLFFALKKGNNLLLKGH